MLLGHVLKQMGARKGSLDGVKDLVLPGRAYESGPKVLLDIGPATPKGQKKPPCEPINCCLDTGAGKGILAPSVIKKLKLVHTGKRKVRNGKNEVWIPEYRVSIWRGDLCILADYPIGERMPLGSSALLGEDFLTWCLFTQDGPNKHVQLEF